tara:strand:- start:229 stop:909 length:681 start_codon:yes stop_codon:yes gene_type:complete
MDEINKFVYVPRKRYEDNDKEATQIELGERFGSNTMIDAYEYDPQFYYDEYTQLNIPEFNSSRQQPQRILSFFNHIKKSLEMFEKSNEYDDETIIFLFRSDMGIKNINVEEARKLLITTDIITELKSKHQDGRVRDLFFVLKKKNINVFLTLYDSYKKYVVDFYSKKQPHPPGIIPEQIIGWHFIQNNMKVGYQNKSAPVINYSWKHVCNKYCGHNRSETKILGKD